MISTVNELIQKIKPSRESIIRHLSEESATEKLDLQDQLTEAGELLQALLSLPVSKMSLMKDMVWDFNNESEVLARNIQGAKSRIDFSKYENLNSTILFELKIAILCALQIPGVMYSGKNSRSKKLKPHTILDIFKATIPFIDKMCALKKERQGAEFFELTHYSLVNFSESDYTISAEQYNFAYRRETSSGLKYLRSNFLQENLFAKPLCFVDLEELNWRQNSVKNPQIRKKKKYLENNIFEKTSQKSSLVIVDFLKHLDEKVADTYTLECADALNYKEAAKCKLSRESYDIYVAIRLGSRGYTGNQIEPFLYSPNPEYWSPQRAGMLKDKEAICKLTDADLNDDFYNYISLVNNSALYIIAQYTGMRPSELSGIPSAGCLTTNEFGHNLITSNIIKGKENYGGLFGDKWAAIPIVVDAVHALQIINRFKQNPYLLSNMNTMHPGAPANANSLSGNGLTYQICAFLAEVLTLEELALIDFSPYTLRHSLAHQMFRASVGLPFISFQLKHFGNLVGSIAENRFSATTIDYGEIGVVLTSGNGLSESSSLRHEAEKELVINTCDPDGGFAGDNAETHRVMLKKYFQGYLEQGYTKDEIFDRMVKQSFAVINVGQGYCYGNSTDINDPTLPCIGSLRCNPNHCKNAVVTKANAPKWREIYIQNLISLRKIESIASSHDPGDFNLKDNQIAIAQLELAMAEAKAVLESLGEEVRA